MTDMEIRLVMHVHQKKVQTRNNFPSLLHIAAQAYKELAMLDAMLPTWDLVKNMSDEAQPGPKTLGGGLRQVSSRGEIHDQDLDARGFVAGVTIVCKRDKEQIYELGDVAPQQGIKLTRVSGPGDKEVLVSRQDLLANWDVKAEIVEEVHRLQFACPMV